MLSAIVKITQAVKKFIATHAKTIINFFHIFALTKLSLSLFSFSFVQSSHFNETKPHNGIQLSVFSVHDLSFHKVVILGGNHNQNSFT
jgi:hypothetical protein